MGYRWLQKVNIPAQELLDRLGLNDLALSQKLKEGLEAVKVISGLEVPDHNVRVKFLDMAYKLKNVYPAEKHKIEEERKVIILGRKKEFINKTNEIVKRNEEANN